MANNLDKIKTIAILMFENRSFDHMLGHLSYEGIHAGVRGLTPPLSNYSNLYEGNSYNPYQLMEDRELDADLPHGVNTVAQQLAKHPVTGRFTMGGFVQSYADTTRLPVNKECIPLSFFHSSKVYATSFLAKNFCICDNWFTPIPTGTQPNRNMAFSGDSFISDNGLLLKIGENNIFDWLNRARKKNKVRWRVYHSGLSYFALYPSMLKHVFGPNFRSYKKLAADIMYEPESTAPEVIIIEPVYKDAPHINPVRANDNHPPLAVGWGEDFLYHTYEAISCNPKKWESTLLLVYYDEHGGFYDHVPPPSIGFQTGDGHQFVSMGPRVPAIVASPMVGTGSVCSELLDHTSVLQLLAEKFTPGVDYSDSVKARRLAGVKSLSIALNNDTLWPAPPFPAQKTTTSVTISSNIIEGPQTEVSESFEMAVSEMLINHKAEAIDKFPELVHWHISTENAAKNNQV